VIKSCYQIRRRFCYNSKLIFDRTDLGVFPMDIYTPQKRSELMSKVGAGNTKPEIVVRHTLHKLGYRFRLHRADLPGKPDIVLPRHKVVVFVHGCFWHHHRGCAKSKLPATNVKFWTGKILRNVERDGQAVAKLRRSGWRVLVIWECETKDGTFDKKLVRFLRLRKSHQQQKKSGLTGKRSRNRSRRDR
jgi:DNA mismatch endonuclease (patch repair protein)